VTILVIMILPVGFAQVDTSHGLIWGVEVGDIFNYHLAIRYTEQSRNIYLDYYVVVDSLPLIPDNISEIERVGSSSANEWNSYFSFFFTNDTEITPQTMVPTLHWSIFPIGNWTCIEEIELSEINTTYWDVQTIDTDTEWGFIITADDVIAVHTDTVRYSKEDGALNLLEMHWQYDPGRFRTLSYIRVGEGLPLEMIVVVAGLTVFVAVVGVLFIKRRKSLET